MSPPAPHAATQHAREKRPRPAAASRSAAIDATLPKDVATMHTLHLCGPKAAAWGCSYAAETTRSPAATRELAAEMPSHSSWQALSTWAQSLHAFGVEAPISRSCSSGGPRPLHPEAPRPPPIVPPSMVGDAGHQDLDHASMLSCCYWKIDGYCRRGDDCWFMHDRADLPRPGCKSNGMCGAEVGAGEDDSSAKQRREFWTAIARQTRPKAAPQALPPQLVGAPPREQASGDASMYKGSESQDDFVKQAEASITLSDVYGPGIGNSTAGLNDPHAEGPPPEKRQRLCSFARSASHGGMLHLPPCPAPTQSKAAPKRLCSSFRSGSHGGVETLPYSLAAAQSKAAAMIPQAMMPASGKDLATAQYESTPPDILPIVESTQKSWPADDTIVHSTAKESSMPRPPAAVHPLPRPPAMVPPPSLPPAGIPPPTYPPTMFSAEGGRSPSTDLRPNAMSKAFLPKPTATVAQSSDEQPLPRARQPSRRVVPDSSVFVLPLPHADGIGVQRSDGCAGPYTALLKSMRARGARQLDPAADTALELSGEALPLAGEVFARSDLEASMPPAASDLANHLSSNEDDLKVRQARVRRGHAQDASSRKFSAETHAETMWACSDEPSSLSAMQQIYCSAARAGMLPLRAEQQDHAAGTPQCVVTVTRAPATPQRFVSPAQSPGTPQLAMPHSTSQRLDERACVQVALPTNAKPHDEPKASRRVESLASVLEASDDGRSASDGECSPAEAVAENSGLDFEGQCSYVHAGAEIGGSDSDGECSDSQAVVEDGDSASDGECSEPDWGISRARDEP